MHIENILKLLRSGFLFQHIHVNIFISTDFFLEKCRCINIWRLLLCKQSYSPWYIWSHDYGKHNRLWILFKTND